MDKKNKEVQGFFKNNRPNNNNKNEKCFVKCDDYKMNMFYNFRRKLVVEELLENRFVQYGK